jgi:hypothetical protein
MNLPERFCVCFQCETRCCCSDVCTVCDVSSCVPCGIQNYCDVGFDSVLDVGCGCSVRQNRTKLRISALWKGEMRLTRC